MWCVNELALSPATAGDVSTREDACRPRSKGVLFVIGVCQSICMANIHLCPSDHRFMVLCRCLDFFKGSGIRSALCGWKVCNGALVMQDSGKWICGVKTLLQKPGCIVYSFGSNGQTGVPQGKPSCSRVASLMCCSGA